MVNLFEITEGTDQVPASAEIVYQVSSREERWSVTLYLHMAHPRANGRHSPRWWLVRPDEVETSLLRTWARRALGSLMELPGMSEADVTATVINPALMRYTLEGRI